MADIADILDAMQSLAVSVVYPNGGAVDSGSGFVAGPAVKSIANGIETSPGVFVGGVVNIGQGWPPAGAVDAAMKAGNSLVSIYAVPSSTSKLPVPLSTGYDAVLTPPIHGMTAEALPTGFRLHGAPNAREYATAIVNGVVYSVVAQPGDTTATLAAALTASLPGATWFAIADGVEIAIPGLHSLIVRIGAPGTTGRTIDRQRQNIMLGTWAPNPSDRAVIGAALKLAIAQNLTVEMPDTSRSIWIAQGENLIDKYQTELAFRRDLTVQVQWDTVERTEGFEVTSVNIRQPSASGPTRAY